jgi:hypothetical protein
MERLGQHYNLDRTIVRRLSTQTRKKTSTQLNNAIPEQTAQIRMEEQMEIDPWNSINFH